VFARNGSMTKSSQAKKAKETDEEECPLGKAFAKVDLDNDKLVTEDELVRALRSIVGAEATDGRVAMCLSLLGGKGDAQAPRFRINDLFNFFDLIDGEILRAEDLSKLSTVSLGSSALQRSIRPEAERTSTFSVETCSDERSANQFEIESSRQPAFSSQHTPAVHSLAALDCVRQSLSEDDDDSSGTGISIDSSPTRSTCSSRLPPPSTEPRRSANESVVLGFQPDTLLSHSSCDAPPLTMIVTAHAETLFTGSLPESSAPKEIVTSSRECIVAKDTLALTPGEPASFPIGNGDAAALRRELEAREAAHRDLQARFADSEAQRKMLETELLTTRSQSRDGVSRGLADATPRTPRKNGCVQPTPRSRGGRTPRRKRPELLGSLFVAHDASCTGRLTTSALEACVRKLLGEAATATLMKEALSRFDDFPQGVARHEFFKFFEYVDQLASKERVRKLNSG